MNTILIPNDLRERLALIAHQRGDSLDTLVRHALEAYLADVGVPPMPQRTDEIAPVQKDEPQGAAAQQVKSKTHDCILLTTLLEAARAEPEAHDEPWLDWDGIEREVAERRGDYQWDEP